MTDSANAPQTLGQRIDAVLAPLYAEAEQHRATLDQTQTQIQQLQQQADAASQGLATIEGQMAEVVRSLAVQDPVLGAVLGGQSASVDAASIPATRGTPSADMNASSPVMPGTDPPPVQASPSGPPAEPIDPPSEKPNAQTDASVNQADELESQSVPLDLDPETDQAMVDELSGLLAEPPSECASEEAAPAGSHDPPPDIAAAAQRAAVAAKELREKAATPE